jgi:hypothetical protein
MAHLNLVFSNVFQRLGLWDRGCCRHLYSVTASPASTVGTLPVVVSALRIALSTQPSPTHRWAAAPSSPYHPPVSGAAGPDAPLLCSLAQCGWGGSLCELLRATSPPPNHHLSRRCPSLSCVVRCPPSSYRCLVLLWITMSTLPSHLTCWQTMVASTPLGGPTTNVLLGVLLGRPLSFAPLRCVSSHLQSLSLHPPLLGRPPR